MDSLIEPNQHTNEEKQIQENNSTINEENTDYFNDELYDEEQNLGWKERFFGPLNSGSVRGSTISIASICFGSACLSLPIAITNVGLILGIFMFIVLSYVSYWSLRNLLYAARKKRLFNYSKLIEECLGKKILFISDVNNIIFMIGVLMAIEFTISDFFMKLAENLYQVKPGETNIKKYQMMICCIVFQIPLSLMKNVSKLQYASLVGVFTLIYTILVVLIECPFYYQEAISQGRNINLTKELDWSVFNSFSILLYAYASHNGILAVYSELKKPTLRRSKKVLDRALTLQVVLFATMAFSGFFSTLKDTPSIFITRKPLDVFDSKDYYMIVAQILYFFSLQCSCALNYNILRVAIKSFFFNNREVKFIWDFLITAFILIFTNLVTYNVNNIIDIIGILGGLCAVIVCYVCPILCFVKSNGLPISHFSNISSIITLIIICVFGLMSTGLTIVGMINKKSIPDA
jgi:amino acid permease